MEKKKSTYAGFTEARAKANKRYMDKFVIARARMKPGKYDIVQVHAAKKGESVSGFINRAIAETIERDNAQK